MTWTTVTIAAERLGALLTTIRTSGGTIASCCPQADGVVVTWTTPG
jgi:hypothetical protein